MEVLNRIQFAELFAERETYDCDDDILWIPEKFDGHEITCKYFVCIRPIEKPNDEYWEWCNNTIAGEIRCFTSDGIDKEWWGFTVYDDILMWALKWST